MFKYPFFKEVLIVIVTLSSMQSYSQSDTYFLNSADSEIQWKVKPQAEVGSDSIKIFQPAFNTNDWIKAVVPGTVFSSYVNAGLEKDPNFGDNIYNVDKSKYDRSFWYRTEFNVPENFTREKIWLNFKGINRKGDIFLNGRKIGNLDGFMQRGRFDLTGLLRMHDKNVLAVLVSIPETPLNNYGSPTYLSSAGWDWMPYVPGLNSGITDKVFLSNSGNLIIENPWVRTDLPTNARAELSIELGIKNTSAQFQQGILKGVINPGNIQFVQKVNVSSKSITEVKLEKALFPQLVINNPKLWWPNGYGEPDLYTCDLTIMLGDKVSDQQKITFGIKKYSYDTIGGVLHISINGARVFIKGGNWGMSEYMLRCRGNEYDTKVRLHKEMNFNMIRNWLGSTTDEEFYNACDKYGMMVWDDFWLNSNPSLPYDIYVLNMNIVEKIQRFRNHPAIAIWCGNNEGWPQPPINGWIKENVKAYDGNDRYYQANSNTGNLSGSGLWGNHDPRYYFIPYPASFGGTPGWGLRTETGTAVFPNFESFRKFIPEDKWWPRNEMWDKHFFGSSAFNATPDYYDKSITEQFGAPTGINDYCRKAQLVNLETNKAMFEAWSDHLWEDASGLMVWMSQSAYPSMVWQTYDYYYDLTGAFWGAKKACEPVHIQWSPLDNSVKVINTTRENLKDLTAEVALYNMDGSEVKGYSESVRVDPPSNTALRCFTIPFDRDQKNLALNKPVFASATAYGIPGNINDGNNATGWAGTFDDDQWINVDLEQPQSINRVVLGWNDAYAKVFKIQVSNDTHEWKDVYLDIAGKPGWQNIYFDDVTTRYVRMLGLKRGTGWGYSIQEFEIYGDGEGFKDLSEVHFIKLNLKDKTGRVISDNFYWHGNKRKDFTALSSLPKVNLKVSTKVIKKDGKCYIISQITNPATSPAVAFAIRAKAVKPSTGEQILPAIMNNNYFSLMKGESREIHIEFDEALLNGEMPKLVVEPYNNFRK